MTAEGRRQLIDQNCKQMNKVAEMQVLGIQIVVIFLSYTALIIPLFAKKTLFNKKQLGMHRNCRFGRPKISSAVRTRCHARASLHSN